MNADPPQQSDLRGWFEVLRTHSPTAALAMPGIGVGLLLLILSASVHASIQGFIIICGEALMGIGVVAYLLGVVVSIFKK